MRSYLQYSYQKTAIGWIRLGADERGMVSLSRIEQAPTPGESVFVTYPHLKMAYRQLGEYFAGQRRVFQLPINFEGTDFQLKVWQELTAIPYGETCTYKTIAERIDQPRAIRAVGSANNRNPLPIIVPCHRIIASSGNLQGYALGLDVKKFLLTHEGSEKPLADNVYGKVGAQQSLPL